MLRLIEVQRQALSDGVPLHTITLKEYGRRLLPHLKNLVAEFEATPAPLASDQEAYDGYISFRKDVTEAKRAIQAIESGDQARLPDPLWRHPQAIYSAIRQGKHVTDEVAMPYAEEVAKVRKDQAEVDRVVKEMIDEMEQKRLNNPPKGSILWALNDAGFPARAEKWDAGNRSSYYSFKRDDGVYALIITAAYEYVPFLAMGSWDACDPDQERKAEALAKKYAHTTHFNLGDEYIWLRWDDDHVSGFKQYCAVVAAEIKAEADGAPSA